MRITSFWAKGYRSLKDVRLEGLGAFNVFYGPNGGGKSNVLAAIQVFFDLFDAALRAPHVHGEHMEDGVVLDHLGAHERAGTAALSIVSGDDFYAQENTSEIILGAVLVLLPRDPRWPSAAGDPGNETEIEGEVTLWVDPEVGPKLAISRFVINGAEPPVVTRKQLIEWCDSVLNPAFGIVDAIRALPKELDTKGEESTKPNGNPVLKDIRANRIKGALFTAKNLPRGADRFRYEQLQALMSDAFGRPRFDAVRDPDTHEIDLREMLPPPNPLHADVSLDRTGLGVVQVYAILASILFAQKRAIGLEEPEAHLHAPTTGLMLRKALIEMVTAETAGERILDQLFIATHSSLFDLDDTGFYDVRLENSETIVRRKPLHEMDEHLWEPGPAKHALEQLLRYAPADVVFRRPDGQAVTASEMLELLQHRDAAAVGFLDSLHGAALRIMRVDSQEDGEPE